MIIPRCEEELYLKRVYYMITLFHLCIYPWCNYCYIGVFPVEESDQSQAANHKPASLSRAAHHVTVSGSHVTCYTQS